MHRRLLSNCRRFLGDRRGNIAILFGLALVPMFGIMGLALDYSWANQQRTQVLTAADNTLLALSKMMPLTDEELQEKGRTFFEANLGKTTLNLDVSNNADFSVVSEASGKLALDVHAIYPLTVGSVLNKFFNTPTTMPISTHSEVQWGNTRLRVALVLDNSLSMTTPDTTKMVALKAATHKLLDQLKELAKDPKDVYVSIIPFSTNVNIGAGNLVDGTENYKRDQWIDFTNWDKNNGSCSVNKNSNNTQTKCESAGTCSISGKTSQNNCTSAGTCSDSAYTSKNNCLSSGGNCSVSNHDDPNSCSTAGTCSISGKTSQSSCGVCSKSSKTSQSSCVNASGTWTPGVWTPATWTGATWTPGVWTPGVWTPADHSTWNGCVIDRGLSDSSPDTPQGRDQSVQVPDTGTPDYKWQAESVSGHNCPTSIVPLTNDWTALGDAVDAMDGIYSTNQPIGMVWGWQTLVGGGPMGTIPVKDSTYAYADTIVLMTDGLNTMNRWNPTMPGNTNVSVTAVDKRMYDSTSATPTGTCKYVKDANIQVFTVQVNTTHDATSSLLQNCATNPSMFWILTNPNDLVGTFTQIGSALANIHLSQ